jgi:hypothetical protein
MFFNVLKIKKFCLEERDPLISVDDFNWRDVNHRNRYFFRTLEISLSSSVILFLQKTLILSKRIRFPIFINGMRVVIFEILFSNRSPQHFPIDKTLVKSYLSRNPRFLWIEFKMKLSRFRRSNLESFLWETYSQKNSPY